MAAVTRCRCIGFSVSPLPNGYYACGHNSDPVFQVVDGAIYPVYMLLLDNYASSYVVFEDILETNDIQYPYNSTFISALLTKLNNAIGSSFTTADVNANGVQVASMLLSDVTILGE
ncbi:MAG: hypothetical protein LIR46_05245 [Bacteroidota bacterium]|nr:hypothetical protein [Bacteroidota bacterium]